MKVLSILILALLGALTVLAAPAANAEARPKPFPGELAMVEARAVFEGGKADPPVGGHKDPDSVPPAPKLSPNPSDTGKMFKKRALCAANYWYCSRVNGCCKRSPAYVCCDFGCCPPGYYCCGWDGRCWRSWLC